MSIELARVRLRGIYAGVAGAILLFGVPAVESVPLASSGYLAALDRSASSGDFRPLLAWIAANSGADGAFRLFELVPFLLAISVPGALALVLWGVEGGGIGRQAMLWLGRIGFGCYALAAVMGIFSSKSAAGAYLTATTAAGQARAAAQFAQAYAVQNWIAHVIGGILVAAALGFVCTRTLRSGRLPMLTAVLELLVAALLLVTALEYATVPARVEAPTGALAFAALALWLIAVGIVLWQHRALPAGAAGKVGAVTENAEDMGARGGRGGGEGFATEETEGTEAEERGTAEDAEGAEGTETVVAGDVAGVEDAEAHADLGTGSNRG